jgi:two-component system response regulator YesN
MYSVFLVEDEIVTREGIRNSMPWGSTPYILAGEAPDGEMALAALRDIKPDILITDIKMPFMDGLTLCRIIKRDQPWMKIIILSGHDEFQYAKEAISIGVEDYLLKPISQVEMIKALDKVAGQIEEKKKHLLSIENLKMRVQSSEEIVREKWLCDLATGQIDSQDAIEKARNFGIDLVAGGYVVMIVEVSADPEKYSQCALVKSIIASVQQGRKDIIFFPQSVDRHILLVKNISPQTADETLYPLAQGIKFETERNTDCRISIGMGPVVDHVREIVASYASANEAIRYMAGRGEKNILGASDMQSSERNDPARLDEKNSVHTKHHSIIIRAKEYIDKNYMNQDVTLNSVADHVNTSPNHFSTIFSQETGETFIEYLTRTRINRAKQLLLRGDLRSSDITYEVGYSDPHYFSFIFKKTTSLSPREFKMGQGAVT